MEKDKPKKRKRSESVDDAQALYSTPWTKKPKLTGHVRVAKYYPGCPVATMKGYKDVLIHTSANVLGGDLSPYVLKNEKGQLLENIWQFSKVYPSVYQTGASLRYPPYTMIWEHPAEDHYKDDILLPAWWAWREKGMNNHMAVRYPNGFHGRSECLFSMWPNDTGGYDRLDYIAARKRIYCGEYLRLAPTTPHFKKLQEMLAAGTSLLLSEVDGPDPNNLGYAPYDQISPTEPGLLINEANIRLLINDTRKPFGHGYVIGAMLMGGQEWLKI